MRTFLQDLKHALRLHSKSAGFTTIAVLTFALGIGASTAVFSVVNAVLLKPLPYPHPERVVLPWRLAPVGMFLGFDKFPWGQRDFRQFWLQSKTFQNLAAFQSDSFNLTGSGEPAQLQGLRASAGFFPSLGIAPSLGRVYTAEEDQPGRENVVVLSHQLWIDRFGGNAAMLGRSIELSGHPYTVLGVMPPDFAFPRASEMPGSLDFPREPQLWVPLALPAAPPPGPEELAVIGRLKPGVSVELAQAELDVYAKQLERLTPQGKGWFNTRLTPLAQQVVGNTRRPLLLMLCAVGVVLLIACSNVASLLLTRSIGRKREFTLRAALGAGQVRLIRQLLTESLLLATAGGLGGILLAKAGIYFAKTFGPADIPRLHEVSLDLMVFAFALAGALVTGILVGLGPAVDAARANLAESLKEGSHRSGGGQGSPATRNALLIYEVALALVLVISTGLLVRTFYSLLGSDSGFNRFHVLTFELSLPGSKYTDTARIVQVYQTALQRLRSLPGVQSAGIGETIPMRGAGESTVIRIPDRPRASQKDVPYAAYTMISPGYFSAVGTPLLRGRDFRDSDTPDAPPVAVINNAMARKYWPFEDAIGKHVGPGSARFPAGTIVGIVADVKHLSLREEAGPEMYVPFNQKVWPSLLNMQVALRTQANPAAMAPLVREAMRSVDPDLPLGKLTTLTTLVDEAMTQPRFSMLLLGAFGALAVALASIGMYGVISYSVAQRTREIGIRMALGARRNDVFRMILAQGARLAGLGIAIGLLCSLAVTRTLARFLYGVQPTDPLTFLSVSLLLVAVALLACYLPARRATEVDPMIALRHE
jgi:putative ABC transport system permease protein